MYSNCIGDLRMIIQMLWLSRISTLRTTVVMDHRCMSLVASCPIWGSNKARVSVNIWCWKISTFTNLVTRCFSKYVNFVKIYRSTFLRLYTLFNNSHHVEKWYARTTLLSYKSSHGQPSLFRRNIMAKYLSKGVFWSWGVINVMVS